MPTPEDRLRRLHQHYQQVSRSATASQDVLDDGGFGREVTYLWRLIVADAEFHAAITSLRLSSPHFAPEQWWADHEDVHRSHGDQLPATDAERLSFAAWLLEQAATEARDPGTIGLILSKHHPAQVSRGSGLQEGRNAFLDRVITPIIHLLERSVREPGRCLYLLARYQRWLAWWQRDPLRELLEATDPHQQEAVAKAHLSEFLFRSGLDLIPEGHSPSGRADLLGQLGSDDPFVFEAKIYDGAGRGISNIAGGVTQAQAYAQEWNEQTAYLMVFNMSEESLTFPSDGALDEPPPRIVEGGRTVVLLEAPLTDLGAPSARGKLTPTTITRSQLVQGVSAPD